MAHSTDLLAFSFHPLQQAQSTPCRKNLSYKKEMVTMRLIVTLLVLAGALARDNSPPQVESRRLCGRDALFSDVTIPSVGFYVDEPPLSNGTANIGSNTEAGVMNIVVRNSVIKSLRVDGCRQKVFISIQSSLMGSMFIQFANSVTLVATDSHFTGHVSFSGRRKGGKPTVDVALDRSYFFETGGMNFVGVMGYAFHAVKCVFSTSFPCVESHFRSTFDSFLLETLVSNVTFDSCDITTTSPSKADAFSSSFLVPVARKSLVRIEGCSITTNASSIVETFHGTQLVIINTTISFIQINSDFPLSLAKHTVRVPGDVVVEPGVVVEVLQSRLRNRWGMSLILIEHASYNNSYLRFEDVSVEMTDLAPATMRGESDVPSFFCFMCRERDAPLGNVTVIFKNVTTRVFAANMYMIRIGGPIENFVVRMTDTIMVAMTLPRNPFGAMIRLDDEGSFVSIELQRSTYQALGEMNNGILFFGHKLLHASVLLENSSLVATSLVIWLNRVVASNVSLSIRHTKLGMPSGWGISIQQCVVRGMSISLIESVIDVVHRTRTLESCALCLPASRIDGLVFEVRRCTITHPSLVLFLSDQGSNTKQRGFLNNMSVEFSDTIFFSATQSGVALDAVLKISSANLDHSTIVFVRCELHIVPSSGSRVSQQTEASAVAIVIKSQWDEHSFVRFDDFKIAPNDRPVETNSAVEKEPVVRGGRHISSRLSGMASFRYVVLWDSSMAAHPEALVFNRAIMSNNLVTRSNLVLVSGDVERVNRAAIHFRSSVFKGFNAPQLIEIPSRKRANSAVVTSPQVAVTLKDSFFPCFQLPALAKQGGGAAGNISGQNSVKAWRGVKTSIVGCVQIGFSWVSESSDPAAPPLVPRSVNESSAGGEGGGGLCEGRKLLLPKCEVRQATISTSRTRTHHTRTRSSTHTLPHTRTKSLFHPRNPLRTCPPILVESLVSAIGEINSSSTNHGASEISSLEDSGQFRLDVAISLGNVLNETYKWRSESLVRHLRLEVVRPYALLERRQYGRHRSFRGADDATSVTTLRGVDMQWIRLPSVSNGPHGSDAAPRHIRLSHPRIDVRSFPVSVRVIVAEDLIEEGCREDYIEVGLVAFTPTSFGVCMAWFHVVLLVVCVGLVIGLISHRLHLVVITVQLLRCTSSVNCFSSRYTTCMQPIFMHAGSMSPFKDSASIMIQNCGIATAVLVVEYCQEQLNNGACCDTRSLNWFQAYFFTVGWSRSIALACIQAALLPSFELWHGDDLPLLGAAGIAFCGILIAVCFWMMHNFASRNVFFLANRDPIDDREAGLGGCCHLIEAPMLCWPVGRWAQRRAVLDDVERRKEYYALLPCLLIAVLSWVTAVLQPTSGSSACRFANNSFLSGLVIFVLLVAFVQPFRLMSTQMWAMLLLVWTIVVVEFADFAIAATLGGLILGVLEAGLAYAEGRYGDRWRAARAFAPVNIEDDDSARTVIRKGE